MTRRPARICAGALLALSVAAAAQPTPAAPGPKKQRFSDPELRTVQIRSSADATMQASRVYLPVQADAPVPLLVQLHTWSGGYTQDGAIRAALKECRERGWALIFPDFRGPNNRPEACASDLAVQDILDAVEYVKARCPVDPQRIYVSGMSGGGHMTLVMATRAPELWAAASAWVPITDLAAWHAECTAKGRGYAKSMERVCGGRPGDTEMADAEYRKRSSLFFLDRAKGLAIDINHGIHDGHTGSVPVSHSLRAFNALAAANGMPERKFSEAQIRYFTEKRAVPPELAGEGLGQEEARVHKVLYRRVAGPVRVTVFAGGHAGDVRTAIRWLAKQVR